MDYTFQPEETERSNDSQYMDKTIPGLQTIQQRKVKLHNTTETF